MIEKELEEAITFRSEIPFTPMLAWEGIILILFDFPAILNRYHFFFICMPGRLLLTFR